MEMDEWHDDEIEWPTKTKKYQKALKHEASKAFTATATATTTTTTYNDFPN